MSSTPGEIIVDMAMGAVIDAIALRVAAASAIDAAAENSHHASIPVSIHHGTGPRGMRGPSRCRHSENVAAHASARSTSAAASTTISFAAAAAPRRGWTSIVVVTCRESTFVRGSLTYSLTTTLAASTTIPVVPMYRPMTPTSPSRADARGSPAASPSARL